MILYIAIGWAIFLVLFYLGVFIEYAYYRYDLPQKFRLILETFTEEEEEQVLEPSPAP